MSQLALLVAVRDYLRATPSLKLTSTNCDITTHGQPFPIAGEFFVSVWPGYWRDTQSNGECLDEEYGVNITVSVRSTKAPLDRWGERILVLAEMGNGLLKSCEEIRAAIHMDQRLTEENAIEYQSIMLRANQIIKAEEANGFVEPLQFQDGGRAEEKPGSWWESKGEPHAGLAQTLTFGKARRVQTLESMT